MTVRLPPSTPPADAPDDIVCACRQITRRQIEAAIAEHGLTQAAEITACLGAGAECGSCAPTLHEMLGDHSMWFEVEVRRHPLTPDPNADSRIERIDFLLPPGHAYPASAAGQHVTVQAIIDGRRVTRSYTVIEPGPHHCVVSIAVRHQPGGELSPWLLSDDATGAPRRVRLSAPLGPAYWLSPAGRSVRPTVCLLGGIGITLGLALAAQVPPQSRLHLAYRTRRPDDAVFHAELEGAQQANRRFTVARSDDQTTPSLAADIQNTAAQFPDAQYVLCGPPGYVSVAQSHLQLADIPAERIHIEKFYVTQKPSRPARSWKSLGYAWGAVAALLPALFLWPWAQAYVPHGHPVIGHEKLECQDCHEPAPGTMRQQIQAKLDYWLGNRESPPAFVNFPVSNGACTACHTKSNDRHPSHRFLEPRFEDLRNSLAPQRCASCHREHEGLRVTLGNSDYCQACHEELSVKNDHTEPSHKELIEKGQWQSCLGCHDFHNNHQWKEPNRITEAIPPKKIKEYFRRGSSPYGEVNEKAVMPAGKQSKTNSIGSPSALSAAL